MKNLVPLLAALAVACGEPGDGPPPDSPAEPVVWELSGVQSVGGHPTRVLGAPIVIDTPLGRAVEFDGVDDGLLVNAHPLAGASAFTLEVVFRPYADGPAEQRFVHLQEGGSKDRILIETRLAGGGLWFLDTYVKSQGEGYTLFARDYRHPIGPWYHAALVVADGRMRHYVDGVEELSRSIDFVPQHAGRTSLGVRINEVSWFRGAIARVRFTPRELRPDEFLRAE